MTFSAEYACVLTGDVARCLRGVDAPGAAQTKLSRGDFDGARAFVVRLPSKVVRVQLLGKALCFVFDGQDELQRALLWAGQFDASAIVLVPVAMYMLLTSDWDFGT